MTFCDIVLFFIMSLKKTRSNFSLILPDLPGHLLYFLKNTYPEGAFNQLKLPGILGSQKMQYHLCRDNFFLENKHFSTQFLFSKIWKALKFAKVNLFYIYPLTFEQHYIILGPKICNWQRFEISHQKIPKNHVFCIPKVLWPLIDASSA